MSEGKDPAIKLFGKTIPVPEVPAAGSVKGEDRSDSSTSSSEGDCRGVGDEYESNDNRKDALEEKSVDKEDDRLRSTPSSEVADPSPTSMLTNTCNAPSAENESAAAKPSKMAEEEQSETSNAQEKTLKKPDKILPCPRCNSMDTKFCYYNNYNINQPRHFCKSCQRYWTAGGTMRNVPVGAGRRKNKTSAAQFRQITVSEALPNGLHHPALKPNGTVLTFGSETPLCESMASVLSIADRKLNQNGFHKPEELRIVIPTHEDDNSSGSSSSVTEMPNCHGFTPNVPCFPHRPWPYPWNPQMGAAFCPPPAFPMPFYPPIPYWGCPLPAPWVSPPAATPHSGPNSPSLGKHSREDESAKENEPEEKCLWVPKTLRIDDPDEAAKSSIWATLGIKNERSDSGQMFKAFESKAEEKMSNTVKETSPALQANPAALSRSISFQERS